MFYIDAAATFSEPFRTTHTVSPHCSRKTFFAKLGGLIATVGILPPLLAKSEKGAAAPALPPIALRPEQRAIARKEGSF